MKESLTREQINVLMRPADFDLGRRLMSQGKGACPTCRGGLAPMAVHENGVRFACGCIRWLPPLHNGRGDECRTCHPELASVIPIRRDRGGRTREEIALDELTGMYEGLA